MADPRQGRRFHLGDILTVTTGRLVAPRHTDAVYDILTFMTGDEGLMTHQLSRAMEECQPHLLRQHPQLASVPLPERFDGEADVMAWLSAQVATFGEYLEVAPLAPEDHTRIDPLTELAMNYPHLTVVPVEVPDGD